MKRFFLQLYTSDEFDIAIPVILLFYARLSGLQSRGAGLARLAGGLTRRAAMHECVLMCNVAQLFLSRGNELFQTCLFLGIIHEESMAEAANR